MLGDVTLGPDASVWYTAVLRGDTAPIVVGEASNVQDGTIIHVDAGVPATVGARVGIGHRVVLHGCTIEDECLIGMGSVLLNGVHIGTGSVVAAGAVVPEGLIAPPGSVLVGVPARVTRTVDAVLHAIVPERSRLREQVCDVYFEIARRRIDFAVYCPIFGAFLL